MCRGRRWARGTQTGQQTHTLSLTPPLTASVFLCRLQLVITVSVRSHSRGGNEPFRVCVCGGHVSPTLPEKRANSLVVFCSVQISKTWPPQGIQTQNWHHEEDPQSRVQWGTQPPCPLAPPSNPPSIGRSLIRNPYLLYLVTGFSKDKQWSWNMILPICKENELTWRTCFSFPIGYMTSVTSIQDAWGQRMADWWP